MQTCTLRHCTNSQWYIWLHHCQVFLLGNLFLNRRHHTDIGFVGSLLITGTAASFAIHPKGYALMNRMCSTRPEPSSCPGYLSYNQSTKSRLVSKIGIKNASLKQMLFLYLYNRSYPHCSHTYRAFITHLKQRLKEMFIPQPKMHI
jgi:hypothetical protein